jgi:Spirocyclase AveC-like
MAITNSNIESRPIKTLTGETHSTPVYWWAALGALVLYVAVSAWGGWATSADFKPAPMGSEVMSGSNMLVLRFFEILFSISGAVITIKVLVLPWIRDRRISWDGMFLIACLSIYLQDPMDNYFNFTFSYNANFFNRGSWGMLLPGWEAPRQNLFAEAMFLMGGMFITLFFGLSVVGCWWLRKAKTLLPNLSFMAHLALYFVVVAVLDFMVEATFCRTELFAYGGTYHALTLWAGQPHQFPIYESTGIASVCCGFTLLRYSRDDRGESWADRGVSKLAIPSGAKTGLSFLALLGFGHLMTFLTFFVPYTWFSLMADSYPKLPSYLTTEICGKGTPYACPSREVPIPSRHSLAITPDDPRLSEQARKN